MKLNFKPLSSFFNAIIGAEEDDQKKSGKEGDDQGNDQGDADDNQGEDQGDTDEDQDEDQGEDQGTTAKNGKKTAKTSTISISQARYESLVAAEAELQKFGETQADRSNFLKDANQLSKWYNSAVAIGATTSTDANAQEKGKKVSKVTAEAQAAYQKAAAKNPKKEQ